MYEGNTYNERQSTRGETSHVLISCAQKEKSDIREWYTNRRRYWCNERYTRSTNYIETFPIL